MLPQIEEEVITGGMVGRLNIPAMTAAHKVIESGGTMEEAEKAALKVARKGRKRGPAPAPVEPLESSGGGDALRKYLLACARMAHGGLGNFDLMTNGQLADLLNACALPMRRFVEEEWQ